MLGLASRHFTFLKESKAKIEVLLGDGRLVLERQLKAGERQNFDILVLDAFRGASPPMHLMTKEAFDIYFGHLAENGILAVNFELDTFEMAPLHRGMAKQFRRRRALVRDAPGRRLLRWRRSAGRSTPRQGLLEIRYRAEGGLTVARRRQVGAGVDRPGQQSDEHHQLGARLICQSAEATAKAIVVTGC